MVPDENLAPSADSVEWMDEWIDEDSFWDGNMIAVAPDVSSRDLPH
jgi:hypothetical protein